uniref:NADH-ubiquinone oxidoreductase chain 6 n=1 Tax=Marsupiomonas sp. NIES 1824 TaxID=1562198 RepID=A0A6H0R0S1_9CHLO|nr:NADH dehydrogenase subunit 6 [Marsupiomonas sp. NIES 1824]
MTLSTLSRLFRALRRRARLRLVLSTHPVSAVISLVQVFVARGSFLRTMGLDFFTFTYIVIYVGAIAVLFLFVMMLLETRSPRQGPEQGRENPKTGRSGLLTLARGGRRLRRMVPRLGFASPERGRTRLPTVSGMWAVEETELLPIGAALGTHLYTTHVVDFLLSAFILLVSIVGSIQVTLSRATFEQERGAQSIFQQMARQERKTIRWR